MLLTYFFIRIVMTATPVASVTHIIVQHTHIVTVACHVMSCKLSVQYIAECIYYHVMIFSYLNQLLRRYDFLIFESTVEMMISSTM